MDEVNPKRLVTKPPPPRRGRKTDKLAEGEEPVVVVPVIALLVQVQVALVGVAVQVRHVAVAVRVYHDRASLYRARSGSLPFEYSRGCMDCGDVISLTHGTKCIRF